MARGKEIVGTGLFIVLAIVLLFALPIIIAYLLVIIFPAYVGVYWYIVVLIGLLIGAGVLMTGTFLSPYGFFVLIAGFFVLLIGMVLIDAA